MLLVNLLLLVSLSVNLLAGGAVAGAVGHEDEEIAVLQNLLRLLFVHRHEDNGFVKRAVVRIGRVVDSSFLRTICYAVHPQGVVLIYALLRTICFAVLCRRGVFVLVGLTKMCNNAIVQYGCCGVERRGVCMCRQPAGVTTKKRG